MVTSAVPAAAEQVGAQCQVGVVSELERAERPLVVGGGFLERDLREGGIARTAAVLHGAVDLAQRGALAEVPRELGQAGRRVGAVDERAGDRSVQAEPTAGRQLVVERACARARARSGTARPGPVPR